MKKGILAFSTSRLISFMITLALFGLIFRLYFLEENLIKNHRLEKDVENIARLVDHISGASLYTNTTYNPDFNGSVRISGNELIFSTSEGEASAFCLEVKNKSFENLGESISINKTEEGVKLE